MLVALRILRNTLKILFLDSCTESTNFCSQFCFSSVAKIAVVRWLYHYNNHARFINSEGNQVRAYIASFMRFSMPSLFRPCYFVGKDGNEKYSR